MTELNYDKPIAVHDFVFNKIAGILVDPNKLTKEQLVELLRDHGYGIEQNEWGACNILDEDDEVDVFEQDLLEQTRDLTKENMIEALRHCRQLVVVDQNGNRSLFWQTGNERLFNVEDVEQVFAQMRAHALARKGVEDIEQVFAQMRADALARKGI